MSFEAVDEAEAGERWVALFRQFWPAYRKWFLRGGIEGRPSRLESEAALGRFMPELLPTYHKLVDLADGDDVAARFLALYRPPAFLSACSQAVWSRGPSPLLVRNYDYSPLLFEGVLLRSSWTGPTVLSMVDCLWGALDGVNDSGLAVSLAFGGSRASGDGFGIPLLVRYVLETCASTEAAEEALRRVPTHMAYNVTVVDREGNLATAYLAPDREPRISSRAAATNHQEIIRWKRYAQATQSPLRERVLLDRLAEAGLSAETFVEGFLEPPLYSSRHLRGWGTLYTAVYDPQNGAVTFRWPDEPPLHQTIGDFRELKKEIRFEAETP